LKKQLLSGTIFPCLIRLCVDFWEFFLFACPATDDFFRSRIDHMIDLRHPLAVLSSRMPWQQIEASVAHLFVRKARAGVAMPDLYLFGEAPVAIGRKSNADRPRVALRIMIALLYLKHAFNESDEGVVERWGETPTWQFFSGQAYFEHRRPCDASTLVKFRQLLGDEGVEELLAQTVNVAMALKLIQPQELEQVLVDSTVQHKAIAHPTDSKLLETARVKLIEVTQAFHGNPQRGHSLAPQMEKSAILMQYTGSKPSSAVVYLGYRGEVADNTDVSIVHRSKSKRLTQEERELRKRRQAIGSIIGHLKEGHRMGRSYMKVEIGDRLHAVLYAAGYNNRWLLRIIARKSIAFFGSLFLCMYWSLVSPAQKRLLEQSPVDGRFCCVV
jgi:hypothetical protein